MKRAVVKQLKRILSPDQVLERPEDRLCYGFDATGIQHLPDVVVCPTTVDQVVGVVRLASEEGLPITPRGAGTGYSGGAVPLRGGVVVALERMNRILGMSRGDGLAVVEAGVVNGVLQTAAERDGLFYPPDPASLEFSTLGGNIAECAGGPRALKYGVTRDYVAGLEFVTSRGVVIQTGVLGRVGNGTFDLGGLLGGSEGTLGIITRAALRVLPKPSTEVTLLLAFQSRTDAAQAVVSITSAKILPSVVELIDKSSLAAVRSAGTTDLPFGDENVVLVEVDGRGEEVEEAAHRIQRVAKRCGCQAPWMASDPRERERIWTMRRSISPALAKLAPTKINEDVCVPRSRLVHLIERIEVLSEEHGLFIPIFGHAGDGNLHVNIMVDSHNPQEMTRAERAVAQLFEATLDVGGTLSGEHGIGMSKMDYLEWEIGPAGMQSIQRVKQALDPADRFNPGKFASP